MLRYYIFLSLGKHKKALIVLTILVIASISTVFVVLELTRSEKRLILATTTSTYDSGLLDYLLPKFEKKEGIQVDVLSVGTGQALELGRQGNADVLLVHSRPREDLFINNNYGIHRTCLMYNDFIIIGPHNDPAQINRTTITTAMERLKLAGESGNSTFYSRGDGSGTNSKELILWNSIGFTPNAANTSWYFETGEGMGTTLIITNQDPKGYTLIDRGTWLFQKDSAENMEMLVEGDTILLNPYGAILINPDIYPHIQYNKALKFIAFMVSEYGQELIGNYTVNNQVLFHPCFGKCNDVYNCTTTAQEIAFWSQYNGGYTGGYTATSSAA
ncbi:MAG: substrate-binding domain-containing protein [Candidatus Lokiarchaeota archaeon]